QCRDIIYKQPITDKVFNGHVIADKTVHNKDQCEIQCFLNPDCVSLNYNPEPGVTPNCQLSSSDENVNPGNFASKPGYVYQAIKNHCAGENDCTKKKLVCQSGYGPHGYRCVCPKCLTGDHCKHYTKDTVLMFPKRSTDQTVKLANPFRGQSSNQFTISMWLQMNSSSSLRHSTPFSYETKKNIDEITIFFGDGKLAMELKGNTRTLTDYHYVFDDKWHHIAISWKSATDDADFFIDGAFIKTIRDGTALHQSIAKDGGLVLGQEQDHYLGGFDAAQSFQGNLTSVNMWDRALTRVEISEHAKRCPSGEGNLVKWVDLVPHKSVSVKYFCGESCLP
ncbi:hypothetical protein QZH41_011412, partial [Actinostola sp. cb2023]